MIELALRLRRQRFRKVYILHWSPLFHRFFQAIGIADRWGFARDRHASALTRQSSYVEAHPEAHEISQYLAAVSDRYHVSSVPSRTPRLFLSSDEKSFARNLISLHRCPIAIAPGGGHNPKLVMPQKRWLPERFVQLGEQLILNQQATLLVVGDASEAGLLKPLIEKYPSQIKNFSGQITLRETAAVIQSCRLFIGNDSGLFHIAGAAGTPSLVFFGPTSPHGKMPLWLPYRLLYSQEPCSPCYKHGYAPPCPYQLKCMDHLSVQSASEAAMDLLKATS